MLYWKSKSELNNKLYLNATDVADSYKKILDNCNTENQNLYTDLLREKKAKKNWRKASLILGGVLTFNTIAILLYR
jgi:hypothetical protein